MSVYKVYKCIKDDEVFFATIWELTRKLDVTRQTITNCIHDQRLCRGYTIIPTAETIKKKCEKYEPPKLSERQMNMQYLIMHLEKYGNCYCAFDPFSYLPDLYDEGFNCTAKEWWSVPEAFKHTTKQYRRTKKKFEGYIVEVKSWTTAH